MTKAYNINGPLTKSNSKKNKNKIEENDRNEAKVLDMNGFEGNKYSCCTYNLNLEINFYSYKILLIDTNYYFCARRIQNGLLISINRSQIVNIN